MRFGSVCLCILVLSSQAARAGPPDDATLKGMDAVVAGEWTAAVTAFSEAYAASPDDPMVAKRLTHAWERATAFWEDAKKRCEKAGSEEGVKLATVVLAALDPDIHTHAETLERPEARLRLILDYGRDFERAQSLSREATRFLIGTQEHRGNWNSSRHGGASQYNAGVTGLAILAILAGDGSPLDERRKASAAKAIEWILGVQAREGRIGHTADPHYVYCHAIATEAMATYLATTGENKKLRAAIVKATRFIEHCRNPDGAWRYGIRSGENDTSVTFWMTAALHRVRALGLKVDPAALRAAHDWVKKMTVAEYFRAGYTEPGNGPARPPDKMKTYPPDKTESLSAAACLIRHWCGEGRTEAMRGHFALVEKMLPQSECPDMYYWHLAARAYATIEGRIPTKWYGALVSAAKSCRGANGAIEPLDPWGGAGGRIYATAITSLALMAPVTDTRPAMATSASDFVRSGSVTLTVPISDEPRATGIYLDEGMELTAVPGGTVQYAPGVPAADPGGLKKDPPRRKRITRKGKFGCLLAQVGREGKPVVLRRKGKLKVKGCGELHVFVNARNVGSAKGGFQLSIRLEKP